MKFLRREFTLEDADRTRINASVQEEKISSEPVCDWCGLARPMWLYAARRMSDGAMRQCWRWAACATCAVMVEERNWVALDTQLERSFRYHFHAHLRNVSDPMIAMAVRHAMSEFHKYVVEISREDERQASVAVQAE